MSDAAALLRDLQQKPDALERLARAFEEDDPIAAVPVLPPRRVVLTGMGSSRYAAEVMAVRMRAGGIDAVSEIASLERGSRPDPDTLVLAISASGSSVETLHAATRHRGSQLVAVTEQPHSPLATLAQGVIQLHAGAETSGVACRTFQHTLLVLRAIEAQLCGEHIELPALCRRVAAATAWLLDHRAEWLPAVCEALDGPDGVAVIAPAERWSSAAQSALMVREGPRRPATGSETGDWSHVDVYLTRTLDYRALFLPGSRWDEQARTWLRERGSTVVAVGGEVPEAAVTVRYPGDDDAEVALATETLVAELVAASWWT